jgi:hypothetical protein
VAEPLLLIQRRRERRKQRRRRRRKRFDGAPKQLPAWHSAMTDSQYCVTLPADYTGPYRYSP